ncbi:MAG: iron-containing alcohol dehydrogenase, partial [Oscillospiraceae bacterium]|nr:iron-containing alcohol dehydrogenase [Oscillospiraceae bacterium]
GGSVIDATKLVSMLLHSDLTVKDLLDDPSRARKQVPLLVIPTTAGTGAEATPNAIVAVPEKELKVGIVNSEMVADYVLLDSRTTKNLPRSIAASTGVDALCHAVECYTSNKANPISDCFAIRALEMIMKNIVPACDDKEALEAKEQMLIASFFAGIAIAASGTTAVHALSYPLGGKYHIAHGVANAMLLTPVMRFNEPVIAPKLADAYDRCYADGKDLTEAEKADRFITKMEEIVRHLDIPTDLTKFGVPREDLESLVESGMDVKRLLNNNMREVTADDARAIYLQVM